MVFIAFFLFIAVIAISLSIHNSSNLEHIESFLKAKQCNNIIYSRGSYKALCEKRVLDISNSFTVDIDKNTKEIKYKDIKNIYIEDLDILINNKTRLTFKKEEEIYSFYESLKDILDKK
ncbi:MAG: hypothetical protein ACQERD_11980 [Campylobacterota bacterium]